MDEIKEKLLTMISEALDGCSIDRAERLVHMYSELCSCEEDEQL